VFWLTALPKNHRNISVKNPRKGEKKEENAEIKVSI